MILLWLLYILLSFLLFLFPNSQSANLRHDRSQEFGENFKQI